jgi:HPt (histidine-containing phosphotransfer) domain-containing protein
MILKLQNLRIKTQLLLLCCIMLAGFIVMGEYPRTMAEIDAAINGRDASKLNRAAHSLKGSAGNFGARPAIETVLRLEMMGINENLSGGREEFAFLAEEMERLKQALAEFMEEEKS